MLRLVVILVRVCGWRVFDEILMEYSDYWRMGGRESKIRSSSNLLLGMELGLYVLREELRYRGMI